MTPAEVARLQREHEAMAHVLSEVENFVPAETMAHLRRLFIEAVRASKERE